MIIALIISLKAFYILYLIFFSIILLKLINVKGIYNTLKLIFLNIYLYLFLSLLILILIVNLFNTGCLIYPVSITCFDNNLWAIPKTEVVELNNWYELWSKAGANPNFRVDNPEVYIQKFNWLSNWFNEYFFTKVSDFLIGITFLSIIVYFYFFPYEKNNFYPDLKKFTFTLIVILILFFEWFYNHPSLRYGGYCLIASFLFIILSLKIESSKIDIKNKKNKILTLVVITLLIFTGRNVKRVSDEYTQYGYNPLNDVFYRIDDQNFEIHKNMKKLINDYLNCEIKNLNCVNSNNIQIKNIIIPLYFIKIND